MLGSHFGAGSLSILNERFRFEEVVVIDTDTFDVLRTLKAGKPNEILLLPVSRLPNHGHILLFPSITFLHSMEI